MNQTDLTADPRETYWNEEYVRYWKARVEEANYHSSEQSKIIVNDSKTITDAIYCDAINLLQIKKSETILELGCGFGRSLPLLCHLASQVLAVDISKEMIQEAKKSCKEKNVAFHVAPSEKLPFVDDSIDVVVCFAVFDATYQLETLKEINRVCKKDARVLLTGKNDNYFDNDKLALEAEIGARKKGHPNYFTDVNLLLTEITQLGFQIETQRFFLRRGDFARQLWQAVSPQYFYEYLLILKKQNNCQSDINFPLANAFSKTYLCLS